MSDEDTQNDRTGFSREYVEKLRSEAAQWRTKYRQLEASSEITQEFSKRNITADPSWVKVKEGMTVSDAVDDLVAQYPHLASGNAQDNTQTVHPEVFEPRTNKSVPKAMSPQNQNTNTPKDPSKGRSLEEIKKDPVARSALRDNYRELLRQQSNQKHNGF